MKKYLMAVAVLLLSLSACGQKNVVIEPNDVMITVKAVDMSAYKGMNSTEHRFKEVDLHDAYTFIEQGGSGIFYMGYSGCSSCQEAVQYLNAVAEEEKVTLYYINIDKEEYHVADDSVAYQEVIDRLGPVLGENSTGEKAILTPDVFQVINGEFAGYHVGLTDHWHAHQPSDTEVASLQKIYRDLLSPFSQK